MLNYFDLSEFSAQIVWGDDSIWGVATHLGQHASLRTNCMELDSLNHDQTHIYKCAPIGDLLVQINNWVIG